MSRPGHHHPTTGLASSDGLLELNAGVVIGGAAIGPLPGADLPVLAFAAPAATLAAPEAPLGAATLAPAARSPAASVSAGLVIDVTYDASTSSAPAGFTAAVTAAVNDLESLFTNPITLSIAVGWGEVGGQTINAASGVVGASTNIGNDLSYATVRNALFANQTSADQIAAAASLPGTDPTGALSGPQDFYVALAEQKALGIAPPSSTAQDGAIGLAAISNFAFDPANRAVGGSIDAIGVLEHEFTEVMGRTGALGVYAGAGIYTPLDLFRYTTSGGQIVHQLSPGPGNFSVAGQTLLTAYNNPTQGGDAADWAPSLQGDAFGDAYIDVDGLVSTTDLREMNVLGYNLAAPTCFAAGTRLATARGEIPIEALMPGDLVRTRFAGLAPIRWIGRRRVAPAAHPDPDRVRPVRVAPGAFGPGRPARPLRLSPEHAVALGGALVPIRLLVNGGSIAWDLTCRRVTYLHILLDRHDLVWAEGQEAETFLDTAATRSLFAPDGDPAAQERRIAQSCLPLRTAPAELEPLWRRLAARSEALGLPCPVPATTADPALALRLGQTRIAPSVTAPGRAVFALPPTSGPVWLVSRQAVPAALRPWTEDRRRLGVRIRRLVWRAGAEATEIALDDPRLGPGWWAPEPEADGIWRWTDGAARLPAPRGGAVLELALATPPAYPLEAMRAA